VEVEEAVRRLRVIRHFTYEPLSEADLRVGAAEEN
jgi:hypothetical protein